MLLIRPKIWRTDLTLTNQTNPRFKFAANGSWSVNWGDNAQTSAAIPISDFADLSGGNIAANGTLNGIYRFTFHEDSGAYTVEQISTSDGDGDGLPDNWELAYGLNSNNPADATADSDGDGLTNGQEYQAGTNPRDPNSALRITSATAAGGKFVVSFPSVAGKFYAVEYTDSLPNATWPVLATNIAGTGGTIPITDTIPAGVVQRYYRVKLLP
jgi:hypothetical protein